MGDHDRTAGPPRAAGTGAGSGNDETLPYSDPAADDRPVKLPAGSRFVLLGTLGAGGMGVVISAHDPQLNRKVALKLLRPDLQTGDRAHWTERLTREAQAMAQLAHPNVVTVYETVDLGEQLAIVMELVDGKNLRAWIGEHDDWREVLAMLTAAGRGLVAAHAVGLVHRDFKPDNVLVGADGRARVTDFGLVTTGVRVDSAEFGSGRVDSMLSVTGNIVGTPAYMAPEQWDGGVVDARTDQFAFCVTAWEALFRERPFQAGTVREQRSALSRPVRKPPAGKAPRWIEPVLRRGLSTRPDDRWPSMAALLHALDPARRRRTPIIVGAALLGTAGIAASVAWALASKDAAGCPDPKAQLAGVWDEAVKTKLAARLTGLGPTFAADVWKVATPRLEAYATAWTAMTAQSCKATRVERTQNESVMDLRGRCLDRRRGALRGLTTTLADADVELAVRISDLVDGLPSVDDCADLDRLTAYPLPAGEAARKAIAEVEAELDAARTARNAGDYATSMPAIDAALAHARQLDHPPVLLEALTAAGAFHEGARESDDQVPVFLREAIQVAARAKDDQGAAMAWAMLVHVLAGDPRTAAEAASIEQAAAAAALRVGEPPQIMHRLLLGRAVLAVNDERPDDGLTYLQDAAALAGISDGDVEEAQSHAAKLLSMTGRHKEALRYAEDALERARARNGPRHPDVGEALGLVSQIQGQLGLDDAAEASANEALAIRRAAYGNDHPYVAQSLQTLANIAARRGDFAKAKDLIGQTIAIREKLPNQEGLASAIGILGRFLERTGDHAGADTQFARAIAIYEATGTVGQREYVETATNWASGLVGRGDCATAMPVIDKVVASFEKRSPARLPMPLILRGTCQEAAHDAAGAITTYDRAYTLCKEAECGPAAIALSAWPLAQLIAKTGGDRKRARELALEVRALLVDAGDAEDDIKELDAWLRKH